MIEDILNKMARQIMALNEDTLTALLPKYKDRMANFAPTQEWEESVMVYFLINGLRIKNAQFNEKMKDYAVTDETGQVKGPYVRPRLRLVPYPSVLKGGLEEETATPLVIESGDEH